jgi:hypothetical protein
MPLPAGAMTGDGKTKQVFRIDGSVYFDRQPE